MGSPRDEEEDKDTTEPPHTEDAQTDSMLPPRVVVQLPDGGVQIGEDPQRLQHEQQPQSTSNRPGASASNNRPGAQPGTEQWLELRRLLYATALEAIALKRKRISSLLVAIDLLYMLMNLAAVIFTKESKDGLSHWMEPMDAVVAILGATLDGVTMIAVLKEHRKAIRVMAILHMCLMLPATLNGLVPLAIIRLLVASFLARLVACLVELDWVLTGQPLTSKPSPAWLQGGLLGVQLCGLRHDYLSALETMDRHRAARGESATSEGDFSGVVLWAGSGAVHPEGATAQDASQTAARAVESRSAALDVVSPQHNRASSSGGSTSSDGPQGVAAHVALAPPEDAWAPATGTHVESDDAGRGPAVPGSAAVDTSGMAGTADVVLAVDTGMGATVPAPTSRPDYSSLHSASSTDLPAR